MGLSFDVRMVRFILIDSLLARGGVYYVELRLMSVERLIAGMVLSVISYHRLIFVHAVGIFHVMLKNSFP
jgi:hypothetical protein